MLSKASWERGGEVTENNFFRIKKKKKKTKRKEKIKRKKNNEMAASHCPHLVPAT